MFKSLALFKDIQRFLGGRRASKLYHSDSQTGATLIPSDPSPSTTNIWQYLQTFLGVTARGGGGATDI